MKFKIKKLKFVVFYLALFLSGCATFLSRPESFTQLNKPKSKKALADIVATSENFGTIKFKMKFSVTAIVENKKETYNPKARCLWNPQKKLLRVRIYYLTVTLIDLLYTGEKWYITDEQNSKVAVCKKIDQITIKDVPQEFLRLLERVPESWIPKNKDKISVAENKNIIKLNWKQGNSNFEMLFPLGSPTPSELNIKSENGASLSALISTAQTNFNFSPIMFTPKLEGYEVTEY
jgi:hypothetical protein